MKLNTNRKRYTKPTSKKVTINACNIMDANMGVVWSVPKTVGDAKGVSFVEDEDSEEEYFSTQQIKEGFKFNKFTSIWDE